MSLKIEIILPDGEDRAATLCDHMRALGFVREVDVKWAQAAVAAPLTQATVDEAVQHAAEAVEKHDAEKAAEPAKATRGRKPKAIEPVQAPAPTPVDVAAQDAADEAAEAAGGDVQQPEPDGLDGTPAELLDRLKRAMGAYSNKYGLDAVFADNLPIFSSVLGPPPQGFEKWSGNLFAGDSSIIVDRLRKAIPAWEAALAAPHRFGQG